MKCTVYISITGSYKPAQNKLQETGGICNQMACNPEIAHKMEEEEKKKKEQNLQSVFNRTVIILPF
jgi:hypothetical protein